VGSPAAADAVSAAISSPGDGSGEDDGCSAGFFGRRENKAIVRA
jgi:hypothetical protein